MNLKIVSERKNSRVNDHPKLLNPLSPKNKNKIIGINPIKEENGEESITFRDCCEKITFKEIEFKNNKLENNNSNEERDHSTSGSSKTNISSSKSNNSTPEVCKIFNKNDNTPIQNEDLFKITPHFINENNENKNINVKLNFSSNNIKNVADDKNKKSKFSRPLTPNLNIIRKSSAPICQNNGNKLISRINNDKGYLIYECQKSINNINKNKQSSENIEKSEEDFNTNLNMNIKKRLSQDVIRTDTNIKRNSFSCKKNKILKYSTNLHTNSSINENNFAPKNYFNKSKPIKNTICSSINNSNYKNQIPFSFKSNRNILSKNKKMINSNYNKKQNTQRKNFSMISNKNSNTSMNKSLNKKKIFQNSSRPKANEIIENHILMPFKSENKINVVHSKVNNELNNLFNGLSDNIAKDPEIHNKIESLIKDIKDIQQVVQRKTQTHFRPRNQNNNSINNRKKESKKY